MTTITFLRLRPAESVNALWAATRRREGSTAVEVPALDAADRAAAIAGRLLPVSVGPEEAIPLAWVVAPQEAPDLISGGVAGWRITVVANGDRAATLDALTRTGAAFLRVRRGVIETAAELTSLPGIAARVSVFVDGIEDAVAAVERGADDLLLRGWPSESVADLRVALDSRRLIERTALPPGLGVNEVRAELDAELFAAYLDQVDGSGAARPRYEWAPGKDLPTPAGAARLSAQWPDAVWVGTVPEVDLRGLEPGIERILERSVDGFAPTRDEIERLFRARGDEVEAVGHVADVLRRRVNGDIVSYVVNRNINYTNQCYFKCGFCAFSKGPRSLDMREDPYLLSVPQVVERTVEAWERGATEVCLQGGIHPDFTGEFYVTVLEAIKGQVPGMHVHGFTPLEVWQGAETLGIPVRDFLIMLRNAGLGTLPGTAAEILDDRVREHLCPDKIRTAQWAEVMITAHELGMRSTSTMMFGHIDGPESWANHFEVLRAIQRRTGGLTEFVPLPFVHMGAPIYLRGGARPGPTWDEVVLVHSVARIAFHGLIDNIQASWVKLGIDGGLDLLAAGANDLGGTLMDELISRSAGASHGTEMTAEDFETAIRSIDRVPRRRTTLYDDAPARVSRGSAR